MQLQSIITRLLTALLGLWALLPTAGAYTNPIRNPGGSDPFLVYTGGYYYLMTTTWTDLEISRATTIDGLKTAEKKVVYFTSTAGRCCNVWAPEVHYLGGKWYIYYTAGETTDLDGQRLHVLTGGSTPWDDYTYTGQLTTEWSIDATVLRTNAYGNYLVFSCFHGVTYQSLCIQKLGDDYVSLTGSISGPAALYISGTTYLAYSASYCWTPYYCVALLTWDGTTDPTSRSAWTKGDSCALSSANGNYGTGHNSFFQSPDATETWIAYHASNSSAGACDDTRYTMVQPLGVSGGKPVFETPAAFTTVFSEPSE